jgi:hypothetical protein
MSVLKNIAALAAATGLVYVGLQWARKKLDESLVAEHEAGSAQMEEEAAAAEKADDNADADAASSVDDVLEAIAAGDVLNAAEEAAEEEAADEEEAVEESDEELDEEIDEESDEKEPKADVVIQAVYAAQDDRPNVNPFDTAPAQPVTDPTKIAVAEDFQDWDNLGCQG